MVYATRNLPLSDVTLTLNVVVYGIQMHSLKYQMYRADNIADSRVLSHNLWIGVVTPLENGSTSAQMDFSTSSLSRPPSNTTHFPTPALSTSSPSRSKISLTLSCTSSFSYLSSPYPPRSLAFSGRMSRKRVKSGAGKVTSGARHHS